MAAGALIMWLFVFTKARLSAVDMLPGRVPNKAAMRIGEKVFSR